MCHILTVLALLVATCSTPAETSTTTTSPTTSPPVTQADTTPPPPTTTTSQPPTDRWEVVTDDWAITPQCCDNPMTGPVSPEGPIPDYVEGAWVGETPEDGYYDVSVSRVSDPPGVLLLEMSRLVSCADLPSSCPPDAPATGIVADPDSTTRASVIITDVDLTVIIRPIQGHDQPGLPEPPYAIRGTGMDLYELLAEGVDHAHLEWIWEPLSSGVSAEDVEAAILAGQAEPDFPIGEFGPDGSTCSPESWCPLAYRGPEGTHLVLWIGDGVTGGWPGYQLYGWWTSLRIEDGRFILYIDAGQVAG